MNLVISFEIAFPTLHLNKQKRALDRKQQRRMQTGPTPRKAVYKKKIPTIDQARPAPMLLMITHLLPHPVISNVTQTPQKTYPL